MWSTGFGGTTQWVDAGPGAVSDRTVTVRLDSNVAPELPWRFEPAQREVRFRTVFLYRAVDANKAGPMLRGLVGRKAGVAFGYKYSSALLGACPARFCSMEGRLLRSCANLSDLQLEPSAPDHHGYLSAFDLFDDMPCWAIQNRGARARRKDRFPSPSFLAYPGAEIDYYAPVYPGNVASALSENNLTRSAENLDRRLSDPRKFIVGVKMPLRVFDASVRRDIIAYLEMEGHKSSDPTKYSSAAGVSAEQHRRE